MTVERLSASPTAAGTLADMNALIDVRQVASIRIPTWSRIGVMTSA